MVLAWPVSWEIRGLLVGDGFDADLELLQHMLEC